MNTERFFNLEKFKQDSTCMTVEGKDVKYVSQIGADCVLCTVYDLWDNGSKRNIVYNSNGEYICEESEFRRYMNIDKFSSGRCDAFNLTTDKVSKKLSISSFSLNINPNISCSDSVTIFRLCDLINGDYNLDFDIVLSNGKKLQRGLVWSLEQKQSLIMSVLKRVYIPNICVAREGSLMDRSCSVMRVIDGKQRITTMISFVNNEFPLNHNGVDYFFNDISYAAKQAILGYHFVGSIYFSYVDEKGYSLKDEDYISIFEYVNFTGTHQDKDHFLNLQEYEGKNIARIRRKRF